MPRDKHKFNRGDVRVITSEIAYQGFFQLRRVSLCHRLFGGGWSQPLQREIFQRVRPWVCFYMTRRIS